MSIKAELRAQSRAYLRASRAMFSTTLEAATTRGRHRVPPPLDKARARQACAPMGALVSVVATVDLHRRRRIWYVVDPHPAVWPQYQALGLELSPGCRVLVDAEAMRPVAVLDYDPVSSEESPPPANGFNPYFDLPPV